MTRFPPGRLWLLTCASVFVASCSTVSPSDEPLPTFAELRAEFGAQPEGRGIVREGDGSGGERYETSAAHITTGEGELARFRVNLLSIDPGIAITIYESGARAVNLQLGARFNGAQFIYGRGDGSGGSGRLLITGVNGSRIEGVFAADLSPNGLVPQFRRIRGAFNAVLDTTAR